MTSNNPHLPEDVAALLRLVDAEWQWSQFSLAWMVNFKYRAGGIHAVLVDPDKFPTLESWVDFVHKQREHMEVTEKAGKDPEFVE